MNCVMLAAGYATRLYPLTKDFPKPLLPVAGRTILDRLIDDLTERAGYEGDFIVVSNHRFIGHFEEWQKAHPLKDRIRLIDDGSTDNENRLGAVRDLALALRREGTGEDVLVLACDNLLDFSLEGFLAFAREKKTSCVMCFPEPDPVKRTRTGIAETGPDGSVLSMEEKPAEPKSANAVPPFYYYRKEDLPLILKAEEEGLCGTDAPGQLLSWMCAQTPFYAWEMPGRRVDIGSLETYLAVKDGWTAAGE